LAVFKNIFKKLAIVIYKKFCGCTKIHENFYGIYMVIFIYPLFLLQILGHGCKIQEDIPK